MARRQSAQCLVVAALRLERQQAAYLSAVGTAAQVFFATVQGF